MRSMKNELRRKFALHLRWVSRGAGVKPTLNLKGSGSVRTARFDDNPDGFT